MSGVQFALTIEVGIELHAKPGDLLVVLNNKCIGVTSAATVAQPVALAAPAAVLQLPGPAAVPEAAPEGRGGRREGAGRPPGAKSRPREHAAAAMTEIRQTYKRAATLFAPSPGRRHNSFGKVDATILAAIAEQGPVGMMLLADHFGLHRRDDRSRGLIKRRLQILRQEGRIKHVAGTQGTPTMLYTVADDA